MENSHNQKWRMDWPINQHQRQLNLYPKSREAQNHSAGFRQLSAPEATLVLLLACPRAQGAGELWPASREAVHACVHTCVDCVHEVCASVLCELVCLSVHGGREDENECVCVVCAQDMRVLECVSGSVCLSIDLYTCIHMYISIYVHMFERTCICCIQICAHGISMYV
jgi:hypothetical protein